MKHNICTMPSDQCELVQQYDEEFSSRPASDLEWRTARRNPQWWSAQAVTHVFFHDIKSFSYIIVPHTILLSKCLFFTNFRKCSCFFIINTIPYYSQIGSYTIYMIASFPSKTKYFRESLGPRLSSVDLQNKLNWTIWNIEKLVH